MWGSLQPSRWWLGFYFAAVFPLSPLSKVTAQPCRCVSYLLESVGGSLGILTQSNLTLLLFYTVIKPSGLGNHTHK